GLVGGLEAAILALCWPVRRIERAVTGGLATTRTVAAAGFSLLLLGLLWIYVANFLALHYLIMPVDRAVFGRTFGALQEVRATRPLTFTIGLLVLAAIALGIAVLAWRFSRDVAPSLDAISSLASRAGRHRQGRATSLAALVVLAFCIGGFASWGQLS